VLKAAQINSSWDGFSDVWGTGWLACLLGGDESYSINEQRGIIEVCKSLILTNHLTSREREEGNGEEVRARE
jgi:hypothetical protein